MTFELEGRPVDLHSIQVRNRRSESEAILELQSQILSCLETLHLSRARVSSILVNKLVYLSTKALLKSNPSFQVSRGWYRWGPCFEQGRHSESFELFAFKALRSKKPIDEVEGVCTEEIPIYSATVKSPADYHYGYLSHIYNEKSDEPQLKEFYQAKHELLSVVYPLSRGGPVADLDRFTDAFIRFDRIISGEYQRQLGIPGRVVQSVIDFNSIMHNALAEKDTQCSKSQKAGLVNFFIETVLLVFASKNYERSFQTSSQAWKDRIADNMRQYHRLASEQVEHHVNDLYSLLPA